MSFYVICVVCIFAWQFCHDLGEKDDVFLQTPKIWQMWYLGMLAYDYASFYQNIEVDY